MSEPIRLRAPTGRSPVLSDESIAYACASGDPEAVGELFDRFHQPIARFIHRFLGPDSDVDDVLQKTFLELARGAAKYGGQASVRSWLFGIAANVARQHIKTETRRRRIRDAVRWTTSAVVDGEARASARAELRSVEMSLTFLTVKQRLAFVLCEIEGFSAREAAQILSTTEPAIWRRVSDARRRVRDRMGATP